MINRMPAERWTFLTNYGHVLLCIAADPAIRLRDVAEKVGITERAAQRIVADLIADGYLESTKVGRRNQYRVNASLPMRHPIEEQSAVEALLELIQPRKARGRGYQRG
jgi:predicted ArsR family transcriptional regulator